MRSGWLDTSAKAASRPPGGAPPPAEAPTIVLLHEGLGCVALWRDVPERLAEATGLGVFAYSRFGYGQSDPVTLPRPMTYMHHEGQVVLPQVLAAAGVREAVLVGHSDGGSIAAIYAGMMGARQAASGVGGEGHVPSVVVGGGHVPSVVAGEGHAPSIVAGEGHVPSVVVGEGRPSTACGAGIGKGVDGRPSPTTTEGTGDGTEARLPTSTP